MVARAEIPSQFVESNRLVVAFIKAGKTGHITLHVKDGRIMEIETHEVKKV